MNAYEGLFIIKPDLKEEDAKNTYKAISETVTKNGGTIAKEEVWGKRLLAYPVKKFKEGGMPTETVPTASLPVTTPAVGRFATSRGSHTCGCHSVFG